MTSTTFPIPHLFPATLADVCCVAIWRHLVRAGRRVELVSKRQANCNATADSPYARPKTTYPTRLRSSVSVTEPPDEEDHTSSPYFGSRVQQAREYLVGYLASPLVDKLTEVARRRGNLSLEGHMFSFAVLCNERLTRLVACNKHVKREDAHQDWSKFLESAHGSQLFLSLLKQLSGLISLTIHNVASNEILHVVSDTCTKLCALDISYSTPVTDLGLVYLCGLAIPTYGRVVDKAPKGCKFLRELIFQHSPRTTQQQIMPRVLAYLLRHLKYLRVLEVPNFCEGIMTYSHTGDETSYHPRPGRIPELQLTHYTGTDEKLSSVIQTCPKLRNFRIKVTDTENLTRAAGVMATKCLDHVTLVFNHNRLIGLEDFLTICGSKINSLTIENLDVSSPAQISLHDLKAISLSCPLLDTLVFSQFNLFNQLEAIPAQPLDFRFLTTLKLVNIEISSWPKEALKHILCGNSPDLEVLHIIFRHPKSNFFFNDFYLDEILSKNPMGRLEEFVHTNGCLTLISGLKLFSARPKLKTLGDISQWDVEASEMETFLTILLRAKSMNLLRHDVNIF